jgi:hypothetical protein
MKFFILTTAAIAGVLAVANIAKAGEPDRVDIKSVYGTNNSQPSQAEVRNISQAINDYYRNRNHKANPNNGMTADRNKYVVFEEVKDIRLVELKLSPVTQSKFAKVEVHILERGYNYASKHEAERMRNTSPDAYRKFANNNNSRDNYLWKLDRERVLEGKLIITREDNNTWKVTGTAIAAKTTKSIK